MPSRYVVTGSYERRYGPDPHHSLEPANYRMPDDNDFVLVGMGFRADSDNITTMRLLFARLKDDGSINQDEVLPINVGTEPEHELEAFFQCRHQHELIVGCGLRVNSDSVRTLAIHTRKIDPATGLLGDPYTHHAGFEPGHGLEVDGQPDQDLEHTLLRGIGLRVLDDSITTMVLYYGTLIRR